MFCLHMIIILEKGIIEAYVNSNKSVFCCYQVIQSYLFLVTSGLLTWAYYIKMKIYCEVEF